MSRGAPRIRRSAQVEQCYCPDCREWNTGDGSICESCTLYPGWRYETTTVRLIGARPIVEIKRTYLERRQRSRKFREAQVERMKQWHKKEE